MRSARCLGVAATACAVLASFTVAPAASAVDGSSPRQVAPGDPALHRPAPEAVSYLLDVTVLSGPDAWSVGYREGETGTTRAKIRHWDGAQWSLDSHGQRAGSALTSIDAATPTDIWAVGSQSSATGYATLTEHWDGTGWTTVPGAALSTNASFNAVSEVGSNDVWAVGSQRDGTHDMALIEHWDGTSWTEVPSPDDPTLLTDVSAVGPHEAWAVALNGSVEHWNGGAWTVVDHANATILGVDAVSAHNVWVVGSGAGHTTFAEHWDGSAWTVVSTPNGDGRRSSLQAVHAVRADDVWAVGYQHVGGLDRALIEHWDGSTWRITGGQGGREVSSTLLSVDGADRADAWAVGSIGNRSLQEHWDGSRWRRVTSG